MKNTNVKNSLRGLLVIAALLTSSAIFLISVHKRFAGQVENPGSRRMLSGISRTRVLSEPVQESEEMLAIKLLTGRRADAWRSPEDAPLPHVILFVLGSDSKIGRVRFVNSVNESKFPGISTRELEIEFSTSGPDSGFGSVGVFNLEKGGSSQEFEIQRKTARWVRLNILSNYGNPHFTELNRFELWGKIDFRSALLISYFIWILGAAIVLAAFGWHQHLARRDELRLRDALRLPTFRNPAKLDAVLIAAGVLASVVGESARVPVLAALASIGFIAATVLFFKSRSN